MNPRWSSFWFHFFILWFHLFFSSAACSSDSFVCVCVNTERILSKWLGHFSARFSCFIFYSLFSLSFSLLGRWCCSWLCARCLACSCTSLAHPLPSIAKLYIYACSHNIVVVLPFFSASFVVLLTLCVLVYAVWCRDKSCAYVRFEWFEIVCFAFYTYFLYYCMPIFYIYIFLLLFDNSYEWVSFCAFCLLWLSWSLPLSIILNFMPFLSS